MRQHPLTLNISFLQSQGTVMSSNITYTTNDRTPYTYFIRWEKLNLNYYGRRTAKNCHPTEFFISYFTSSKYVKEIISQYGFPDIIKIHKIFSDVKLCCEQEEKFLTRVNAANNPNWINKTNGDKKFNTTGVSPTIYKITYQKRKNTVKKKYGVENISQSETIKQKKKEKSQEKYGVNCNLQSDIIIQKSKQTKKNLYNNENYNNRQKAETTCLKKYGVKSHNCILEIKQKKKHKAQEKYGVDNVFQSEEIKKRIKQSNMEKYGVDHIAKLKFLSIIDTKKTYNKSYISKVYPELKQYY